jgi:hypothetical protein
MILTQQAGVFFDGTFAFAPWSRRLAVTALSAQVSKGSFAQAQTRLYSRLTRVLPHRFGHLVAVSIRRIHWIPINLGRCSGRRR